MSEFLPIENFKNLNPDQIMSILSKALNIPDDEKRKIHNINVPDTIIDFFKLKNITQTTAIENGLLLYMYLIIWKENNPLRFNSLEEFFISYAQNYHVVNRRNDPPAVKS